MGGRIGPPFVGIGCVYFGRVEGEDFDGEVTGAVAAVIAATAFFELLLLVIVAVPEASAEEGTLVVGLISAFFRGVIESEPFDGFMVVLVDNETDANAFLLAGFVSDPACPD